jgi:hypothetical protein
MLNATPLVDSPPRICRHSESLSQGNERRNHAQQARSGRIQDRGRETDYRKGVIGVTEWSSMVFHSLVCAHKRYSLFDQGQRTSRQQKFVI